nr:putative d-xylulose reductase a [Quercus suber]
MKSWEKELRRFIEQEISQISEKVCFVKEEKLDLVLPETSKPPGRHGNGTRSTSIPNALVLAGSNQTPPPTTTLMDGGKPLESELLPKLINTLSLSPQNPSFVLQKPGSVVFEDRPIPTLTSDYDVLVEPKYTGICGSDVHYWVHGAIGPFVVKDPMVLGHESSGIISAVGARVTTLQVGDRVCMEPGVCCRRCARCKEGNYNLCLNMKFAATPPYDGTLARYYVLPEDFCYKLPEHVSLEEGALMEPLSVGVHVVRQGGVQSGDSVVVFGAGPVGVLCCAVARAFGATKVVCIDVNEERLAFAKSYAATHTVVAQREAAEEGARRIIETADLGLGADVTIDATGAEPCIQVGIHVTRGGGTYVQAGNGKPDISFPIGLMGNKELSVKGSFRYKEGDYRLSVGLVASGKINVKQLITGRVAFEDAEKAFADVKAGKGIKTLICGPGVSVSGGQGMKL